MDATSDRDTAMVIAAREGDDGALRSLVDAYRPMVWGLARDRYLPGGDRDDLAQEGMVGLWYAIRDHDATRGRFGPFARLCVDRQMWSAVSKANRQRHQIMREATSYEDWMDVADGDLDPAALLQGKDGAQRLMAHMRAALSALEHDVISLYTAGESYDAIGQALDMHRKGIDNALQRARRKIQELVLSADAAAEVREQLLAA
ncbi:RNA polymerase sporulation sigma factor SigH [soil metagenome]